MMLSSKNVLISDAKQRKSLAVIRSLGKSGFLVTPFDNERLAPGFWSRYASKGFKLARLESALDVILRKENRSKFAGAVYIPMEENDILELSEREAQASNLLRFLIPDPLPLQIALSKYLTIEHANILGIKVPWSAAFESPISLFDKLSELRDEGFLENFLIKPDRSSGARGLVYLDDPKIIIDLNFLEEHWGRHGALVLQERIPNGGVSVGVSLLLDQNSNLKAVSTHKRIHSYPVSGGPSTCRETFSNNSLEELSVRLMKSLNWKGIAMVEWLIHPTTNEPYLIEINPRFWGSLELAIRSGVDFPTIYANLCLGIDDGRVHRVSKFTQSRWFFPGEILRYAATPRKQRERLSFLIKSFFVESDEYDATDKRGTFFTLVYMLSLLFKPKYWTLLRR
jgi:predicted ATP-grasp superfamily ATP-dependent carboligase